MKTTKTIITAILLCFFAFANAQQKKELTKEETVKYINDLLIKSYQFTDEQTKIKSTVKSVILDGRILTIKIKPDEGSESVSRRPLMNYKLPLKIKMEYSRWTGDYDIIDNNDKIVLFYISLEEDAKRLKNALEHLIKLLKAEPETDPFAN